MKKLIDLKLLQILIAFYSATSLVSLFKIYYLKSNNYGYESTSWNEILLENILLDWAIVILFMTVIALTTKYMLLKNFKWIYIAGIHIFLSLFIGFVIYFLSSIYYYLSGQITFSEINAQDHFAGIVSVLDLNFLIYFSMISIVYTYYYFQKVEKNKIEKITLTNQLINARLNILKYKLHPHFLFNTLNSISSLIETDTKLAQDTIADFGDLLRDLLDLKDTSLIPLKDEIKISKRYLEIMSIRFSDNLDVSVNFDKSANEVLVPSLILLPIIENSIKHGYSYNNNSLKIDLSIINNKKNIIFKIKNNGASLKSPKYGNGLKNTVDRLEILYKKNFQFSMKDNKEEKGITTTISIPYKH